MRSKFLAAGILLAVGITSVSPGSAASLPASCTDQSLNSIPCGGQTASTATPLSEVLTGIDMNNYTGSQWFGFSWSGGNLTISATNTQFNYDLVLDTAALTQVDSDSFGGDIPPYTASLTESSLAAGNYVVGLQTVLAEPTGSITFSGPVGPIPEPASMALFGMGLAGLSWVRRRKRA